MAVDGRREYFRKEDCVTEIKITVPLLNYQPGTFFLQTEPEMFSEPVDVRGKFTVQFSRSGLHQLITGIRRRRWAAWSWHQLARLGEELAVESNFTEWLCPAHLSDHWQKTGVVPYTHQLETMRKVVQQMRGRAILADEVGLGKTIEAGMILKEYMLRQLVRRVLILTPASLCWQWYEEMKEKFRIPVTLQRSEYDWDRCQCLVASLDTAKREPHRQHILAINWDMLIIDEAHKLKNASTKNWQFVNEIHKKYFLMLTATPVQNDLKELYNLITLLKPGQLGTYRSFKQRFVVDKRTPRNPQALRSLLNHVMIRNRRGSGTIEFTRRIVRSVPVELTPAETELYEAVSRFIREQLQKSLPERRTILPLITLQREVCSSARAAALTLQKLSEKTQIPEMKEALLSLYEKAMAIDQSGKIQCLLDLLRQMDDKTIIFTEYRASQAFIRQQLEAAGLATVGFDGTLSRSRKEFIKFLFRRYGDVLVSTESGGEGLNLQYCHNVINFDLPWNPMRLEQRIGRVHRLGQTRDVNIFNLATRKTIEEHILYLLHEKINMFQMVVGQLDNILSNLNLDKSFESHLINIFIKAETEEELRRELDRLGDDILQARKQQEPTILDTIF